MRTTCQKCGGVEYARGLCKKCYDNGRYRNSSPEKKAAYRAANIDKLRRQAREWNAKHPERCSVKAHHQYIFHPNSKAASYKNMPFELWWNPDLGGSFKAAEEWIIENIGKRPDKTYQLHVVDRNLGFVPGNLTWVPTNKHRREELVNRLLLENQNLRKHIEELTHEI